MKKYTEMNHEELLALKKELDKEFEEIKAQGLALDMSRGKPSNAQLELSMEMMDVLKGDSLPHSSGAQAGVGTAVGSLAQAQPGDIIANGTHCSTVPTRSAYCRSRTRQSRTADSGKDGREECTSLPRGCGR